MKYAYIGTEVKGLNRGAIEGEQEGNITPQQLVHGMNAKYYKVVDGSFTPKDEAEIQAVVQEQIKESNAAKAKAQQEQEINKLIENDKRKTLGLPPKVSLEDEETLKAYVQQLQADADNPSEDEAYNPPLPPGVTPPAIKSLMVKITREEGWQGALGFRVVLESADPDYVPTNLALSVYSAAECTGYLYTTGAFQYDAEADEYFAVCPPGQEPGDTDVHMGLLYGAAPLACFTLEQGVNEKNVYAYEEEV